MSEILHVPSKECFSESAGRIAEAMSLRDTASDEFTRIRLHRKYEQLVREIAAQCYCFQVFAIDPVIDLLKIHNSPSVKSARMGIKIIE